MPKTFDAIVIGTGQSGPSLAVRLAKAGQTVAIIERGRFGGTCVNTGCIPTKTMVASARAAYVARRGQDFGVMIDGDIRVDMKRVKARKDEVSGASRTGVEGMLNDTPKCTVYRGHARFASDRAVRVNDDDLVANQIFINVGARATIPSIPGLSKVPYLTNSSILEIDFVPKSLIVVGGSYIGLEFGQMFRRFGSEVTIFERGPRLMGREDEDVSTCIADIMRNEGVDVRLNASGLEFSQRGNEIEARTDNSSAVGGSHVLVATGRRPNTDHLGIENTSIKINNKGFIDVDDQLRTTAPGIWAIGDCNGKGAFTHTSYNDFEIVAANLLDGGTRRVSDRITAYNVYIDPPLGRAGMTEAQVRASGRKALIGKRDMTRVGRAVEKGETQGFMKVLVDAESEEILGAAILGTGGDEAVQCVLDVMYTKANYTVLQRAVNIHPTVSELIPTMLGNLEPLVEVVNH
jgi:pyruvate/2-oxoglutarate dehydrogenase complex dihydrolipoamide dehydrogenase (E3) component